MCRLFFIMAIFLLLPVKLLAADFVFEGPAAAAKGSSFKLDIFLDTKESEVNAVGGSVAYAGDNLILEDVLSGGSLVSLWLDEPALDKVLNNRLEFNGLIPGGYSGQKAYLFSLLFKVNPAASAGNSEVYLNDLQILLNDGQGTKLPAPALKYIVEIKDYAAAPVNTGYHEAPDKFPPEKFIPLSYTDPSGAEDASYLAFHSSDKESGLSHYEIARSDKLTTNYQRLSWTQVESPYKLKAGDEAKYIYVKAVDRQGNFQVSVVNPTTEKAPFLPVKQLLEVGGILLGLILVIIILRFLRSRK